VDFGQRQAVRDDRMSQLLVRIHADMSGIIVANTTTIELAPDAYDSSRRKPDMIEPRHLAVSLLEKRREVAGKIRCPQMRLEDV